MKCTRHNPTYPYTNRSFILTVLILLALASTGVSVDFHLFKNYTLGTSNTNIAYLMSLGINTIGVQQGSLDNCTVKILTGTQFESQLYKSTQTWLATPPRFNGTNSVITTNGTLINDKMFGTQVKFPELNISGNGLYMPQGLLYFSRNESCPTLTKFNISNQQYNSTAYEQQNNCTFYSSGYVAQDLNQQVAYAAKNKLYFVDSELNLLQTFQEPQPTPDYEYSYINSFVNETSQLSSFVVQFSNLLTNSYRLIQKNGTTLNASHQFYNPTSPITLTNLTDGASTYDADIYHWQNLSNPILAINFTNQEQQLNYTFTVAVAPNQTFFVQANYTGDYLIGYEFNTNGTYQITKLFQKQVPSVVEIYKGFFNKAGDTLIFSALNINYYYVVCHLNITSLDVYCMNQFRQQNQNKQKTQKQANLKSSQTKSEEEQASKSPLLKIIRQGKYGRFMFSRSLKSKKDGQKKQKFPQFKSIKPQKFVGISAYDCTVQAIFSDINRILVFCINYTATYYQNPLELHLYSIDQLQFISSTKLYIPYNAEDFRIVINEYKEDVETQDPYSFLVIYRLYTDPYQFDQAGTYRYYIQNDLIYVSLPAISYDISFWNVYAYGNYIASMKLKNSTYESNYLKFYSYNTGLYVKQLPYDYASYPGAYMFEGSKNILLIDQMFVLGSNDVFDLSQDIESSTFFRGLVFPQYFSNYAYYYEDGMKIIFPKSYYLYYYKFADYTNQPYKLIYNIMYPPVKDIVRIYNTQITFDTFEINKYFPAYPNVPGRQCPISFSIVNSKYLVKFKDCAPYAPAQVFDLDPLNRYNYFNSIFRDIYQSTSKQNIVLSYEYQYYSFDKSIQYIIVEIRSIENPNVILWSSSRPKQVLSQSTYNIQFITAYQYSNNTQVTTLMAYTDNLLLQNSITTLNANNMDILQIADMDIKPACYAIAGKALSTNGTDSVVYVNKLWQNATQTEQQLKATNSFYQLNDTIRMVILSEDCNKVAYLTYKNWIYVENITNLTNPNALFEQELPATYIAFIGIDRLLVNTTDNGINIINLPTNITDSADNIFSLLADEVQEQKQQNNLKAGYFQYIAVSKDGTLVAANLNETYVQINMTTNSTATQQVRLFRVPVTEPGHYIVGLSFDDNNTLLVAMENSMVYELSATPCPYTYVNFDGVCWCNVNQTQLLNQCACLTNFVPTYLPDALNCTCPQSFTYNPDDISCTCPYGYVQNQQCYACSFPCETCSASGLNCNTYVVGFYVIVIVGSFFVLALIIGGIYLVMRKRMMKNRLLESFDDNE